MRKISFFFTMTLLLIAFSANSFAKQPRRQISGEEMTKKMFNKDRTFWAWEQIDRLYFKTNGELQHQINEPRGNLALGTVLDANWAVKGNSLCWSYTEETTQKYNMGNQELCFEAYTRETEAEFMIGNHPSIRLKAVGAGPESKTLVYLYSWHIGDYIFDPEYVPSVYQGMQKMRAYRETYKGKIPDGSTKREDMKSYMQQYYDLAIGNVFAIDRDYMYYLPNGDYYWITGAKIDQAKGDMDKMIALTERGVWSIKENIHCWTAGPTMSSCEFVFPPRKGLKNRTFEHFLGTFHTGMTRIHNDNVEHVRHLRPGDTEAAELFKRLAQQSGY